MSPLMVPPVIQVQVENFVFDSPFRLALAVSVASASLASALALASIRSASLARRRWASLGPDPGEGEPHRPARLALPGLGQGTADTGGPPHCICQARASHAGRARLASFTQGRASLPGAGRGLRAAGEVPARLAIAGFGARARFHWNLTAGHRRFTGEKPYRKKKK
ncbi:hypothetical protein NL676_018452 [Syzygium grande]|nr:hypothetical protein NL676_018452 [Syzygium grande]